MTTPKTPIEWAAPPASRKGAPTFWDPELLDTLRANPGRWALVAKNHPNASILTSLKRTSTEFEAVSRRAGSIDGKQTYDIYARYVGASS